MEEATLRI